MVPSHAGEWFAEGIAFAAFGWIQIALAGALVLRPDRRVAGATAAVAAIGIAAWAWTRAVSMPWGPEAGRRPEVSRVDLTTVAFEAVLLALLVLLAWRRPRSLRALLGTPVVSILAALTVFGASTWALASPSALDHAHSAEPGATDAGSTGSAAAVGPTGATHDHGDTASSTGAAAAGVVAETDSTTHGHSTADAAAATDPAHGHNAELAFLFPDGNDRGWSQLANGDDHGLHTPDVPIASLTPETRALLEHQLDVTVLVAQTYPTVADSLAAGYHDVGGFSPGLGTHLVGGIPDFDGVLSDDELLHPTSLIYAGSAPDAPIAGFMYTSMLPPTKMEGDAGFAGPNDHWHTHSGVCLSGATALGSDGSITEPECTAQGGRFFDVDISMTHVWTVPAYTSPLGVFSHDNPAITCNDGTYFRSEADFGHCADGTT